MGLHSVLNASFPFLLLSHNRIVYSGLYETSVMKTERRRKRIGSRGKKRTPQISTTSPAVIRNANREALSSSQLYTRGRYGDSTPSLTPLRSNQEQASTRVRGGSRPSSSPQRRPRDMALNPDLPSVARQSKEWTDKGKPSSSGSPTHRSGWG